MHTYTFSHPSLQLLLAGHDISVASFGRISSRRNARQARNSWDGGEITFFFNMLSRTSHDAIMYQMLICGALKRLSCCGFSFSSTCFTVTVAAESYGSVAVVFTVLLTRVTVSCRRTPWRQLKCGHKYSPANTKSVDTALQIKMAQLIAE